METGLEKTLSMARCASCGRTIDAAKPPRGACTSCSSRAAIQASQTPADAAATGPAVELPGPSSETQGPIPTTGDDETIAEMIARLRDYAAVLGEDLGEREPRVLRALARGNGRPYRAEVNRLARRFVDLLESSWV